jgi:DNA-directed RNA polymerase subunit RPC12/RpoP
MTAIVPAICLNCAKELRIPYTLIGAPVACPSCGKTVIPKVPLGTIYPDTGYETSFKDFISFLRGAAYRKEAKRFFDQWFGFRIRGDGDATNVGPRDGEGIDLLTLHQMIQDDPAKQLDFYRTLQASWR